ncbi:MAG: PadR family transcriptional regulator [Paludibacter sp.]|nr:PadR family transcriptional regulator [Bacteroidales bacterium]MCM1068673.1 PadR family transcriptional regulator [Prevotella sp.]MCM1353337.1 PadR family transcriptional regulator [Bacteroides sp.]MCM1442255.1 PadR family transcriptional regulator [Muribaculum sp.]MCM1481074.1 PadR family transcriptional regulator [Paludibacter sp.]
MIDNIKSQMRKGILEYCILEIISQQEAYASEILEYLKAADLLVVEGTLYPLLSRMKNAGILAYRWQESPSGPPRKYFCITDKGRDLLSGLEQEWRAINASVNKISNN